MPRVPFPSLPDHARLWVFAAERPLEGDARDRLLADVDAFLEHWAAHGAPLRCGRDLVHGRFLLVAVDEQAAGVSGCSIDALTRQLREHERQLGMALLDNGPVHYRTDDGVARASRVEFGTLADTGAVTPETVVFDNTVPDLGAVRAGKWETPARDTWYRRAFFRA
ncbi:MAG: hypothetical protein OEY20_17720 [Gemmatimonadota bacterium]|nr:hypothetical protein [Gemmatimonadota bacterium]MDH5199085.1 hypothetical protein [Gemmatimonadota bacterium]